MELRGVLAAVPPLTGLRCGSVQAEAAEIPRGEAQRRVYRTGNCAAPRVVIPSILQA